MAPVGLRQDEAGYLARQTTKLSDYRVIIPPALSLSLFLFSPIFRLFSIVSKGFDERSFGIALLPALLLFYFVHACIIFSTFYSIKFAS